LSPTMHRWNVLPQFDSSGLTKWIQLAASLSGRQKRHCVQF
jgi:hypothetical protein